VVCQCEVILRNLSANDGANDADIEICAGYLRQIVCWACKILEHCIQSTPTSDTSLYSSRSSGNSEDVSVKSSQSKEEYDPTGDISACLFSLDVLLDTLQKDIICTVASQSIQTRTATCKQIRETNQAMPKDEISTTFGKKGYRGISQCERYISALTKSDFAAELDGFNTDAHREIFREINAIFFALNKFTTVAYNYYKTLSDVDTVSGAFFKKYVSDLISVLVYTRQCAHEYLHVITSKIDVQHNPPTDEHLLGEIYDKLEKIELQIQKRTTLSRAEQENFCHEIIRTSDTFVHLSEEIVSEIEEPDTILVLECYSTFYKDPLEYATVADDIRRICMLIYRLMSVPIHVMRFGN